MVNKESVTKAYRENLKKKLENDADEYIQLEKFLEVTSWFDSSLAIRKKEEVTFEEDKEEIDQEIKEMKALLYQINISKNGLLHIDNFVDTILSLWPLS